MGQKMIRNMDQELIRKYLNLQKLHIIVHPAANQERCCGAFIGLD